MIDYVPRYPLLEALLAQLGLSLKGRYTITDAVQIFGVSRRTVYDWIRDGRLRARNLGPYRFLSEDLEECLQNSVTEKRRDFSEDSDSKSPGLDQAELPPRGRMRRTG